MKSDKQTNNCPQTTTPKGKQRVTRTALKQWLGSSCSASSSRCVALQILTASVV